MIIQLEEPYYMAVFYILSGLIGLCVGSFLNVVIYRVPNQMSISHPGSHCPKCDYALRWYDNIPIVSYCILGGKCRNCREPISFRYTFVEAANLLLWLGFAVMFRQNLIYAILCMAVSSVALCVCFIDLDFMMIPDRFQIILGVLGVAMIFFDTREPWYFHLLASAGAGGIFLLVSLVLRKILGRDALGGGDVKYAFAAGLILGLGKVLLMMLFASVVGSVVMLILRKKNGESREIPFAPFLSGGLVLALLCGNQVLTWYESLLYF